MYTNHLLQTVNSKMWQINCIRMREEHKTTCKFLRYAIQPKSGCQLLPIETTDLVLPVIWWQETYDIWAVLSFQHCARRSSLRTMQVIKDIEDSPVLYCYCTKRWGWIIGAAILVQRRGRGNNVIRPCMYVPADRRFPHSKTATIEQNSYAGKRFSFIFSTGFSVARPVYW